MTTIHVFSRSNAQTNCLDDFIERNNLLVNWNYANVSVENTYCNFALNHFSCIDHFIMSKNVFDSISKHNVISDVQNPSSHNILSLSFGFKVNHYVPLQDDKSCNINKCKWAKILIIIDIFLKINLLNLLSLSLLTVLIAIAP